MLLEADQDLPPEIRKMDLLLVDRSAGHKLPRGEGLYVFRVPTGLAVKRVEVGLKRGFVVNGAGISEELGPIEIDQLLVGKVIFRGGESVASLGLWTCQTGRAIKLPRTRFRPFS
jgi:hypothetical protein